LVKQFLGEALLFSTLAFLLAVLIANFSLPLLNKMIQRNIILYDESTLYLWLLLIILAIVIGLISGIYPALILSSFKPLRVLKGVLYSNNNSGSLRNVFVIIQFTIASVLIITTLLMYKQLKFIKNKDIGFVKEQIIVLPMNTNANKNYESFKNELKANTNVRDVTAFNIVLGNEFGSMGSRYKSSNGEIKSLSVSHLVVDLNYLDFFKIKLLEGRSFSKEFSDTAGHSYIINETLAKQLETKKVIGTPYAANWIQQLGSIIGVSKDFNFNSLHNKVAPLYISMQNWDFRSMAVKLKEGNKDKGLAYVELLWKKYVPDMPFTYTFLDEHLNSLYQSDQQISEAVTILALLGIIIACLGLFGVALFTIQTRRKEIGIRKVLGASIGDITFLLSRKFLLLVMIALIISFPIAWTAINKWLQEFAYHIKINIEFFVVSSLIALLAALITISVQVIRAANSNPVNNLRVE
jgi:putative ABC transport system permease protein